MLLLPVWVAVGLYVMTTGSTRKQKLIGMLSISAAIILGLVLANMLQTGGMTDIVSNQWQRGEPVIPSTPLLQKLKN